MKDIKIDENRDLLVVDGDLVLVGDDRDAVVQELNIRLAFFYSEWFLDITQGIPYLEVILKKGVSAATINGIFIREINKIEDVNEILEFESTYDNDSRTYRLDFKLNTKYGIIENSQGVGL